jgi:hypothetical protein
MEDSYCPLPFMSLTIHPTNKLTSCMMSENKLADVIDDDPLNNSNFQELRTNMLNGKWSIADDKGPGKCINCYYKETNNLDSQRQNWLRKTKKEFPNINATTIVNDIYHLNLNFGNICNFKCRMCSPNYSNSLIPDFKYLQEKYIPVRRFNVDETKKQIDIGLFFNKFHNNLKNLQSIWVTGGEPFIDDKIFEFINLLSNFADLSKIKLSITTNGSRIDFNKLEALNAFKSVALDISVDTTGELFEYMRSGGVFSWQEMLDTIYKSKYWQKQHSNRMLMINGTFQIYNSYNTADFYNFFAKEITQDIQYRILTAPPFLSVGNLPNKNKEVIKDKLSSLITDLENTNINTNPVKNCIKALQVERKDDQFQYFIDFTNGLDLYRNVKFSDYCSELFNDLDEKYKVKFI